MSISHVKVKVESDGVLRVSEADVARLTDAELELTLLDIPSAAERRQAVKELLRLLPLDTGPWSENLRFSRSQLYSETSR